MEHSQHSRLTKTSKNALKFGTGHASELRPVGNAKRSPSWFGIGTGRTSPYLYVRKYIVLFGRVRPVPYHAEGIGAGWNTSSIAPLPRLSEAKIFLFWLQSFYETKEGKKILRFRFISTARLKPLLALHLQPINPVVYRKS